jgi:hypothetical protein
LAEGRKKNKAPKRVEKKDEEKQSTKKTEKNERVEKKEMSKVFERQLGPRMKAWCIVPHLKKVL